MNWGRIGAMTRRIIIQFRRDRRTVALLFIVPTVVLSLLAYLFRVETSEVKLAVVSEERAPAETIVGAPSLVRRIISEIDRSDFWRGHSQPASRSTMNVTWNCPNADLDALFVRQAEAAGMKALEGHRSIGGIRASLYNATPMAAVEALVSFMRDFESKNG